MPAPSISLRPALVLWLYAAAIVHILAGLTLTWAGHSGLLDGYLHTLELAFWGADAVPAAGREQQVWWLALFGATLQSYSLYMLALVHLGNRLKAPAVWGWLIAGILLWAPQDMWLSAQQQVWSHLWLDGFALLVLVPPLFWLYRHDRRKSPSVKTPSQSNPFAGGAFNRVLITGGTGFIGEALVNQLLDAGHSVSVLTRDPLSAANLFNGRARCVHSFSELSHYEAFDVVINLAGAPVAGPRWTPKRQAQLLASRVGTTEALMTWLQNTEHKPALWIQASAIGFYGVRDASESLDEHASKGDGFMAELCARWEAAAQPATEFGVRQVVLRLGVVFGPGGALTPLLLPFRLGFGGRMGDGRQIMSWVHRDDVLQVIARAFNDDSLRGTYNMVAPETVSQAAFAEQAGKVLKRPVWFHIPAAPVRAMAGEMAQLFFDGQRVVPQRLTEAGYTFRYPTLDAALRDLT
ncbi:TIGR01777 family oxidoreductase [Pseudomonas sp. VE 196-7]|uniref:TIGR01777 family oxidoreductase n=1 Tax=unclassified Pseudomonas TaxID=196821 RepID=UPI000D227F63|nr:TIGR01777 family oxidoreductase [Pseudomonas sp. VE 196-7]AVX91968.1 TIGR01777 family protein [Pseudomonas koreensis]MCU7216979.1 TIGR01777 family oxidoreductase [Pseudomonas sp. VE 196-7]